MTASEPHTRRVNVTVTGWSMTLELLSLGSNLFIASQLQSNMPVATIYISIITVKKY